MLAKVWLGYNTNETLGHCHLGHTVYPKDCNNVSRVRHNLFQKNFVWFQKNWETYKAQSVKLNQNNRKIVFFSLGKIDNRCR